MWGQLISNRSLRMEKTEGVSYKDCLGGDCDLETSQYLRREERENSLALGAETRLYD